MDLVEKDLKYIWHPCSQMKDYEELPPIIVDRARGIYLYDTEGNRYADVVSSWWCIKQEILKRKSLWHFLMHTTERH